MARIGKIKLGDCLIEKGFLTQEQLTTALAEQKTRGTKLGETLIDLGYVEEKIIIDVLCDQLGDAVPWGLHPCLSLSQPLIIR